MLAQGFAVGIGGEEAGEFFKGDGRVRRVEPRYPQGDAGGLGGQDQGDLVHVEVLAELLGDVVHSLSTSLLTN